MNGTMLRTCFKKYGFGRTKKTMGWTIRTAEETTSTESQPYQQSYEYQDGQYYEVQFDRDIVLCAVYITCNILLNLQLWKDVKNVTYET